MFLAVGALLHQLQTFNKPTSTRRTRTLLILGILIPVSAYHCWADEIYMHQITFASMVLLCGRKIRMLVRERIPNAEQRSRLLSLANGGLGKAKISGPKMVLRFTWWHILTGIGAYVGMAVVEYLVTVEDGKTDKIEEGFVWPVNAVLRNLDAASSGKKAR
ncbi:uncharacterized protein N0V89_006111 [Didymosphaeria variabile]|uniref:Uncharacterized protein n=1 Tax=Didymosphaeria variabile TaxID=1932322 RepID=A0A9W8XPG8_9PLEO|nr:uncharacterized protein N0V89_006111 [Didymosphaeria variabile]KAJ4354375.1 hypothetical protein N0V89_006111 [Didymosphaeria variabile]